MLRWFGDDELDGFRGRLQDDVKDGIDQAHHVRDREGGLYIVEEPLVYNYSGGFPALSMKAEPPPPPTLVMTKGRSQVSYLVSTTSRPEIDSGSTSSSSFIFLPLFHPPKEILGRSQETQPESYPRSRLTL